FRAADSHPALPTQQQTPATALPVLPAGLVLGPGRATALSRPAAKRKTADPAADPAESLADTGVGEQSAEPQIPAVPIEPLPPASTGPAVGTAKEAR
ncbi:MAG: hypothetical protein K2Q25_03160, partial [Mycobacteriaceae bacterium]|nr:hypothetical protein [Mycobacteriaceae bacterium]